MDSTAGVDSRAGVDSTAGVDSGPAGSLRGRPWLVLTLVCLVVSLTGIGLSIMSVAFLVSLVSLSRIVLPKEASA